MRQQTAGFERRARVVMEPRLVRFELDGPTKPRQSVAKAANVRDDQTAVAQGVGMVGVEFTNIVILFKGFRVISRMVQGQGAVHCRVDSDQRRRALIVRFMPACALHQTARLSVHGHAAAFRFCEVKPWLSALTERSVNHDGPAMKPSTDAPSSAILWKIFGNQP
ncbi:MAG: hypothetical protein VYA71_01315 [Pseudomonadota bacterium]|nr:hypothetical protein [Pseudomonadota bacterium]